MFFLVPFSGIKPKLIEYNHKMLNIIGKVEKFLYTF